MIVCEGLTKTFGSITAIQDFDIQIPDGRIFGLLGPNGAGKDDDNADALLPHSTDIRESLYRFV